MPDIEQAEPEISWDQVRQAINALATKEGVWAGAPLPIDHLRLTVEPRYPWQGLNGKGFNLEEPESKEEAAEANALDKLLGHVGKHKFKQYVLCGMFLETSLKSGVTYLFKKLRPTLALRPVEDHMKVIAALCLHPVGYYQESYGGCMVPTDDVLAHLLCMRGDEHFFWRKANQHQIYEAESGV